MRAEILVELGDALSALGNAAGAEAAFDEAATMAAAYGGNRLRALAESGAARYVTVFADNPVPAEGWPRPSGHWPQGMTPCAFPCSGG